MKRKRSSGADKLKKMQDRIASMNLGGGGYWRPEDGRNTIRILPEAGNMDYFFAETGRHYLEGKKNVMCPKESSEGELPCPLCELNEALWSEGDKEAAKAFRVARQFWVNIVDRKNPDTGPQIFTPGVTVFQMLVGIINDVEYGDITDIDAGFDIKIEKSGTGRNTEYQVRAARSDSHISDDPDQVEEWLVASKDLQQIISDRLLDYDTIIKEAGISAFFSADDDEEEEEEDYKDEDEDDIPFPSKTRSAASPASPAATASSAIKDRLANRRRR